jgi:ATP-dependent helicase/nuclease subunit A
MTDNLSDIVIGTFDLNENQLIAAKELSRDVVVTAGAGSGKTRTLVARYAGLLAEGLDPRQIAAITFTTKAAMQMRSKVRESIATLEKEETNPEERQRWSNLSAQIDSARIGTIHSLCAEILRNHPAEAGLDPRFEVLEEGLSQVLKKQVVEETLNKLIDEERFVPLLASIPLRNLRKILGELLVKRFETQEIFDLKVDIRTWLNVELQRRIKKTPFRDRIVELQNTPVMSLFNKTEDKLTVSVPELLRCWKQVEEALEQNDPAACATFLYEARRNYLKKEGKASVAKEIIGELQDSYDLHLNPLIGGKGPKDVPPSIESEQVFENLLPLLGGAFTLVHQAYQEQIQKRQALDFDDLEHYAHQLLKRGDIRAHWQQELKAVMVDEYQDTNQYQRDIVNALAGQRGCLFIVGDMRQSIYRFRRADVTVFREEKRRIERESGRSVELDLTYRQPEPLLNALGDVLAHAIQHDQTPPPDYFVPVTPMVAKDKEHPANFTSPHMEFVYGAGEDAASARPVAARALANRLLELKAEGQIEKWDDVALLFRASTGFPFYEEALEEASIPFVTVAGRGFYNRPEIRDLINILRVLANPTDNLAFAGLLRSPAFGLSDAALYLLRSDKLSYWQMLQGNLSVLSSEDRYRATRCVEILNSLLPLVDRIPVAELLKLVVDNLDYRAMLATTDKKTTGKNARASGGRLWRNVDKLLEDTQTSKAATVRDFLEMLSTLDDAGAREGEAPAEADGSVRLMTIHKAKGLEFPVVVLADAGRMNKSNSELVCLSNEFGVTFKLDPPPMLYSLSKELDKDKEECEALRVLYVALTRAQHKLIVSSHVSISKKGDKVRLDGWAKTLDKAAGGLLAECLQKMGEPVETSTSLGYPLSAILTTTMPPFDEPSTGKSGQDKPAASDSLPLYKPATGFGQVDADETEDRFAEIQSWKVFSVDERVSGKTIGNLVHKAIQRRLFQEDSCLMEMLESETYNQGLVNDFQRQDAISRAVELLSRLRRHPLWVEVSTAQESYSELPYSYVLNGKVENRIIDLLYRDEVGWHIIDFKTDSILFFGHKQELTQVYTPQVRRYKAVVESKLGQVVSGQLCFLDDQGEVSLVKV